MKKHNADKFESSLQQALKGGGHLFPTSDEEVKNFERLYGSTDIEMPEKFKTPDFILSSLKKETVIKEEATYAMAARSGKKLPKEVMKNMRKDRDDAVAKSKASKKKK